MARGQGRPNKVGRGVIAFAAGVAVVGISLASAIAADTTAKRRGAVPAGTTPINAALVQSYVNNPQLNGQRAATRAVDENVSIALGGYRPRVTATGSLTESHIETLTREGATSRFVGGVNCGNVGAATYGVTATQTLFNGFQTGNRTRQAESQVFAARELLRTTEQTVLLSAATAYMNLLRDTAILELQRSNVTVLEATLRQTRDRFNVGEVTRTDVAQAESRLAAGRSQLLTAESNYITSRAVYRQVIGVEPGRLVAAMPVDRLSPRNLAGALARGRTRHPTITTAASNVDA